MISGKYGKQIDSLQKIIIRNTLECLKSIECLNEKKSYDIIINALVRVWLIYEYHRTLRNVNHFQKH